ncbi:hypothetical protein QUB08_14075 [Microcoleus sp. BR0-C5]|uniref:hypothetical protein n=1 Tax=Microcoleus sp. BR0-C5 TaxID=2818713 RepID=UPI002FD05F30
MRQGFQSLSDSRTHRSTPIALLGRSGFAFSPPGIEIPVGLWNSPIDQQRNITKNPPLQHYHSEGFLST